jgi:hypothetical protein
MLSLRARSRALGWLAAGAVAGGLLVGSAWYATSNHAAGQNGMVDGEPVARQVMVRPAGEKVKNGKQGSAASLPVGSTNGGSDATRQ